MKIADAVCVALFSAFAAFAVAVSSLPEAVFPDTEVSTNFPLAGGAAANRKLVFTLELQASPSNNVEVAIGCDADGDGHLSLDETGLTVGYDCGEWFVRSAAKDFVSISTAPFVVQYPTLPMPPLPMIRMPRTELMLMILP